MSEISVSEVSVSEEFAITAMCVWEELLALMANPIASACSQHMEEVGAGEMRLYALHTLVPAVESAYGAVSDQYDRPFDFEFVPRFVELIEPLLMEGMEIPEEKAIEIGHKIAAEVA